MDGILNAPANDEPVNAPNDTIDNTDVQSNTPDWRQMLGDYANDPNIQKFKSPQDLAKSYIEIQKLVGRDKIPVPKSDEELPQVLSRLGLPKDPKEYPSFEDEVNVFGSKEDAEAFKELAHKAGLLPQQYAKLYEGIKAVLQQDEQLTLQQRQEMFNQAIAELKRDFGEEFDRKVSLAQRVFNTFSDDVKRAIIQAGLDVNPNFIKALASLGEYYKEDSFTVSNLSPMDAKAELEAIKNNPNHPFFNKEHPEHEAAVEKVKALYKIIHGK